MATTKKRKPTKKKAAAKSTRAPSRERGSAAGRAFCSMPVTRERPIPPGMSPARWSAIFAHGKKWVSGTTLRYHFMRASGLKGAKRQLDVVRDAFEEWKALGIGLDFVETDAQQEAEVRIGFQRGDGAWSYLGRDILTIGAGQRTMNFGWDLTRDPDTALHEIGHTLAMPHEHQNPFAGIRWDEEAVYTALAAPPNRWDRDTTFHNIIRKIHAGEVIGSEWDPDSIMHYPFEPGMILQPEELRTTGLQPAGGLSDRDKAWVREVYPPERSLKKLRPLRSEPLRIGAGEQADFELHVPSTRDYTLGTFGVSDTVMVLFEAHDGDYRYVAGDDDSGTDLNARIQARLRPGRDYRLRLRLYHQDRAGETAVMMW